MTSANPFEYRKPITLDTLDDLFSHHQRIAGGWRMTTTPPEPTPPAPTPPTPTPPAPTPPAPAPTPPAPEPHDPVKLGFPADTKVEDMKVSEQAAYWRHQAQKHEKRATEWWETFGKKPVADVKSDFDKLREATQSDQEKALDGAKSEGRREASIAAARSMLELALDHVDDERRTLLLSTTDVSSVILENGQIDTAKVKSLAQALAPVKGSGEPDLGQGRRGSQTKGGVAAGRSLYQERRGKKSTSTTDS